MRDYVVDDDWVLVDAEHCEMEMKTVFAVTGFGPFQGVQNNPTQEVVRCLRSYLNDGEKLPGNCVLGQCHVLETSGKSALPDLMRILDEPIPNSLNEPENKSIVHKDAEQQECDRRVIWVSSCVLFFGSCNPGQRTGNDSHFQTKHASRQCVIVCHFYVWCHAYLLYENP